MTQSTQPESQLQGSADGVPFSRPFQSVRAILVALLAVAMLSVSAVVGTPGPASSQTDEADESEVTADDANAANLQVSASVIEVVYAGFFGRSPSVSEAQAWAAARAAGKSDATIIAELETSVDQKEILNPLFRLYQAYFLRQPDPSGLNYWITIRRGGASLIAVANVFESGIEFKTRYGNVNNAQFVELLYRNILRRPSEPEGRAYWNNVLNRRQATRGELVVYFSEGIEFVTQTTNSNRAALLYLGLFGRNGSPAEIANWARQLKAGTPYATVVQNFLDSGEYAARAASLTRDPLTGSITFAPKTNPALAFKIDNHDNARPQSEIHRADIVVEEEVEYSLTRLIAIFHSDVPAAVGPIRSVRTSDFHVLQAYNRPLLAASGANPNVLSLLDQVGGIENVTAGRYPKFYFRDRFKSAPHNLYARTAQLLSAATSASSAPPQIFKYRPAGVAPVGGVPASSFQTNFGNNNSAFTWDAGLNGWRRSQNGVLHKTRQGVQIAPENVVVQVTNYGASPADSRSPEAHTIGQGTVYIFTDGQMITGTWSRTLPTDRTIYKDSAGREIQLTPGNTWVSLIRNGGFVLNG